MFGTKNGHLETGTYELSVQVTDVKGNKSSTQKRPYKIHFEVIENTTVTNFFPYPNPFSTNMKFAYTLTGYKQPENIKIQIMTITGKIVREINEQELGFLRIGKHLTDFSWDGTDEFGDRLANGVYLYRVLMEDENQEKIEHRTAGTKINSAGEIDESGKTSTADNLFKKGWGKIYILR